MIYFWYFPVLKMVLQSWVDSYWSFELALKDT
jgi:hypothetical protein